MRIAFVTETFLPKVDGVVNTLCQLLDYLAPRGHESLLLAPDGGYSHYAETPIIGYPALKFPFYPEMRLVPPTVRVYKHLAAYRPDLVHLLSPVSLGVSGLHAARRLGLPVVASFHTDLPGFAAQWGLTSLERPLWRVLRSVHNGADLNLCPSNATRALLERQQIGQVKIWTRGVDTERFHPRHRTAAMRARLSGDTPEAPLLLFVSRLSPEKRADWLLPVIEALPQARLAIIGDGPARARLERQFAGTPTVFTGYLRGEALAQAYASADLFIFPGAHETLGNVVLEAMASGLPVVSAASGGPLDLVQDGRTGLLFDPGSQEALIDAVAHLLVDPGQRQRMAVEARRHAEGRSWPAVFDRLLHDYRELLHAYGNRRTLRRPASYARLL